ncbi:PfkB family carbohydrate kinase [Streptomyces sp. NBC_01799]|nr:PfkB family carbohydrate kinase [Streptomyces sp. NBC_01800]WSA81146.1 PfkB family carbohydrate kinase [Streptomyces sp. NBC_01799]
MPKPGRTTRSACTPAHCADTSARRQPDRGPSRPGQRACHRVHRPQRSPPARTALRLPRTAARWCAAADILRLSEEDCALLAPGAGFEEACDTWHAAGTRLVVITLGGRGALASLDGSRVTVPAPPVVVVDTVGAGDSFTAGLLHRLAALGHLGGRLDELTLEDVTDACAFAGHVAALTCAVPGANPPWADESALRIGAA